MESSKVNVIIAPEIAEQMKSDNPQEQNQESTNNNEPVKGWKYFNSLDGSYRGYTIAVLTNLFLTIIILYFESDIINTDSITIYNISLPTGTAPSLLYSVIAAVIACFFGALSTFLMLTINFRKFEDHEIKKMSRWLFASFVGVIFTNMFSIFIFSESLVSFTDRVEDSELESFIAFSFIHICAIVVLITMDIIYVRVLFKGYFTRVQDVKKLTGWEKVKFRLKDIRNYQSFEKKKKKITCFKLMRRAFDAVIGLLLMIANAVFILVGHCFRCFKPPEDKNWDPCYVSTTYISDITLDISRYIQQTYLFKIIFYIIKFLFNDIIMFSGKIVGKWAEMDNDRTWYYRALSGIGKFLLSISDVINGIKPSFVNTINELMEDISENEIYKHSTWVKAAVVTSIATFIYFGIQYNIFFHNLIKDVYEYRRDIIIDSFTQNGELSDFFFRVLGFSETNYIEGGTTSTDGNGDEISNTDVFIDTICALPTTSIDSSSIVDDIIQSDVTTISYQDNRYGSVSDTIETAIDTGLNETVTETELDETLETFADDLVGRVEENLDQDRFYNAVDDEYTNSSCFMLTAVNMIEESLSESEQESPTDIFFDSNIGKFIYLVDAIILRLKWSNWVGFALGLFVCFYSLLSVMAQYKRLSLAIRCGLFIDLSLRSDLIIISNGEENIKRVHDIISENSWYKIIKEYPMSNTVFFFGILISTTVIQLFVSEFFFSIILAYFGSLFTDNQIWIISKDVIYLLIAMLIAWFLNGPLAQVIIGESILVNNYVVHHEKLFLLFLLVYSCVKIILGIFIALVRLMWIMITAFLTINRLDKSFMPILKSFDIGHSGFMAMVLTHHAFMSQVSHETEVRPETIARVISAFKKFPNARIENVKSQGSNVEIEKTQSVLKEIEEDETITNKEKEEIHNILTTLSSMNLSIKLREVDTDEIQIGDQQKENDSDDQLDDASKSHIV